MQAEVIAAAYTPPTSSAQASHFRAPRSTIARLAAATSHTFRHKQPHRQALPSNASSALRHRNTHPSIAPPSPHVSPRPFNPHRQNGCYVHYRRPPGRIARRTSARSPSCRGGKVRIAVLEVPHPSYIACVEAPAGKPPPGAQIDKLRAEVADAGLPGHSHLPQWPFAPALSFRNWQSPAANKQEVHMLMLVMTACDCHPRHHLHDRGFLHGRRRQGRQVAAPDQRQEQG